MTTTTSRYRRDDIIQLKDHLSTPELSYRDISRQQELARIRERWPLIAETTGRLSLPDDAAPVAERALLP